MCCRSDGGGFSAENERVESALITAKNNGADLSELLVAEDHKGSLWLTFSLPQRSQGASVKDLHLIAKAWEEEGELYECVFVTQLLWHN